MAKDTDSATMLIRFQMVDDQKTQEDPYLLELNPDLTLHETRGRLELKLLRNGQEFQFLWKERRIKLNRERSLRIIDILPKLKRGIPVESFKFKDVQYQKVGNVKKGDKQEVTCCGIVFLWRDNVRYSDEELRSVLIGPHLYGFSFIPSTILTTHSVNDHIGKMYEMAAYGLGLQTIQNLLDSSSSNMVGTFLDHGKNTPLHYAATNGHLDVCQLLVNHLGSNILQCKDQHGRTPLHCAFIRQKMDVIIYMLSFKPDLDAKDVLGVSCRKLLFKLPQSKIDYLFENIEFRMLDDRIILFLTCLALQRKNISAGRELCKIVKPISSSYFKQPLHLAAELGNVELTKLLLNREYSETPSHSPLEYDRNGHLPLHYACQHGHCDIIPLLYSDVLTEKDFQRATKLTVSWRKFDALLCLSELRIDFVIDHDLQHFLIDEVERDLNKNGKLIAPVLRSVLHANQRIASEAARQNNIDVTELLYSLGMRLDLQDEMGRTPLHESCQQVHIEMILYLIDHGLDCHLQDWQGSTVLHYACRTGNHDILSVLLDHAKTSFLIDVTDNSGRSPLLAAANSGHTDVVVYLLKYTSCDVWLVDIYNKSLLNYLLLLNTTSVPVIFEILRKCKFQDRTNDKLLVRKSQNRRPKKATFQCSLCEKLWHVFSWHESFTHMCLVNGKSILKKIKRSKSDTCTIIKLPYHSTAHLFRAPSYTDIVISAIESHIIAEHTEYVDLLLNMLDVDLSMNDLSLLCGLCAKYFSFKSLDIILRLWTIPNYLLNELMLIVIIMEAKTEKSRHERLEMVKCLLESGACPNFLLDNLSDNDLSLNLHAEEGISTEELPSEISINTFDRLLERLSMTKESKSRSCYQPLEIAVIDNDLPLVKCLVEGGASTQISFSIHLAILKGHCDIIDYLLNIPKASQSMSVLGNESHSMFECCTDDSGLLQTLCVYEGSAPIQSMLRYFPNILQCHKILRTSTVKSDRPRLFLHKDREIHKLLYQRQDKSSVHLRQLPLTKLMIQIPENDYLINEIFNQNQHLSGIEVDNDTIIHGACEVFVASVDRKLWEKCHLLLSTEGMQIIWECLLGKNSYCTCNIYRCGNESTYPVLSMVIFDFISKAPMECVHLFFNGLKCVLSKMDVECLQEVVMRLKGSLDESFDEGTVVDQSTVLQEIILCILDRLKSKHEGLYCASKLILALPEILNTCSFLELTFKTNRIRYIQLALESKGFHLDSGKMSMCKLVNDLNLIKPEVRLMKMLQKLSSEQKKTIIDKDISLAELSCLYGELHILKACLAYLETKLELDNLLDVAAGFGHKNIVEYLINQGAHVSSSTISSSCQGPKFLGLTKWGPKIEKVYEEKVSLETIQWLYKSTDHHAYPGCSVDILENSIRMYYWNITRWCLDNCQNLTCCTGLSKAIVIALARGPEDVCLRLVKIFDWLVLGQEEARNALNIAIKRNDKVTDNIVKPMLSSYEFNGLDHLEQQDKHKRTFMHFVCAQGRMTIVEMIFNQLSTYDNHQINQILNMPDASNATPLWYALSNRHWALAKLLILNGCILSKMRKISLTRKRVYLFGKETVLESHHRGQVTLTRKGTRSCEVSDRVGSDRSFFEDIYDTNLIIHKVPKDVSVLEKVNPLQTDKSRNELRILVDLVRQSLKLGTSLLNVAIGTLNFQLVPTILEQPLKKVFLDDVYESPVIYAIVNNHGTIFDSIAEYGPGDRLASAILRVVLGDMKMSNSENFINQTIVQNSFSKRTSQSVRDLFKGAEQIVDQTSNIPCFQHIEINRAIPWDCLRNIAVASIRCKEQFLSEPVLFLSAVLGQPRLFDIIRRSCNSDQEYNKLLTTPFCDGLSAIDLIIIFGSKDKMSSLAKKDNGNRTECLKTISDNSLELQNITWQIIKDQRLYKVVTPILEQIKKDQSVDAWANRVQDAIKYGYEEFVIKLCDQFMDELDLRKLVPKFICLSALFGRTEIFFHYMNNQSLVDVDFMSGIPNINWNSKIVPFSILEYAIISDNLGMVKNIVEKLMTSNRVLDVDVFSKALKVAYRKGNTNVTSLLEPMSSSLNYTNKTCYGELCLIAASNGHESLVSDLLINHNIDVTVKNEFGYTVFDYVCMYGFEALAEMLLSKFKVEISTNHIYLARSFGHINLRTVLTKYSSHQSHLDSEPCGWFRSLMRDNEMNVNENCVYLKHFKTKRLSLTLENLLKNGDDRGALHYCKTAQEEIVLMMKKCYEKLPLLHLCARYKNNSTLEMVLDLIKLYSTQEPTSLLTLEFEGKIPIVTAIECGNVEAVGKLVHHETYSDWIYRNGETVLHIAAKNGNEDIVRMLYNCSPTLISAKDNFGLIPASTAVAMGHHHVLHLLCGPQTERPVHHCNHIHTNFDCFDCLRNYCIGWFKCLHSGRISSQHYSVRNIYDRKKSNSGFRLSKKKRGKKAHHSHPIQKILEWRNISKSSQIINAALCTMGYPQVSVNGELFLLLSELGCEEEVLAYAIKKKITTVVLQLLEDAKQSTQFNILEIAHVCVGYHLNDIVQWIHMSRTDITSSVVSHDQSILEAAYGMGNMEIVNMFEAKMNGTQRVEKLNVLRDLVNNLPFSLQYRLEPQQFKVCQIEHNSERLSDFDIIRLLPRGVIEEMFEHLDLHQNGALVYPRKIFGKSVIVDTDCIRRCTTTSKLSETDVISTLFSKLVIGRYVQEISKDSGTWLKLRKIVVRCNTDQSVEPCTYIEDDILHDDVTLVQNDHSHQWIVRCSDLPKAILPNPQFKLQIEEKLRDIELNIRSCIPGSCIKIIVDWTLIDASVDSSRIIKLLDIDSSSNPLSQLNDAISLVGGVLRDVWSLYNKDTRQNLLNLLASISMIEVHYSEDENINDHSFTTKLQDKLLWKFKIDHERVECFSPLVQFVTLFRSTCINFREGVMKLQPFIMKKPRGTTVVLDLDWSSLTLAKTYSDVHSMVNCIRMQLSKCGSTAAAMPFLKLDIRKVVVKCVPKAAEAGIVSNGQEMTIAVHVENTNSVWSATDFDYSRAFQILQTNQMVDKWKTKSKPKNLLDKILSSLQNRYWFVGSFEFDMEALMNRICMDNSNMAHPSRLFFFEINHFAQYFKVTFPTEFKRSLDTSNYCWCVGNCRSEAGMWCWLTKKEVETLIPETPIFTLSRSKSKKFKLILRKAQTENLNTLNFVNSKYLSGCLNMDWRARGQILTVDNVVYYIADPDRAWDLLQYLDKPFEFDNNATVGEEVHNVARYTALMSCTIRRDLFNSQLPCSLIYQCWFQCIQMGVNFVTESNLSALNYNQMLEVMDLLNGKRKMLKSVSKSKGIVFLMVDQSREEPARAERSGDDLYLIVRGSTEDSGSPFENVDFDDVDDYDDCDIELEDHS